MKKLFLCSVVASASCSLIIGNKIDDTAGFCGDGIVQPGVNEQCDDGNTANGDGCEASCIFSCGNGVRDAAEECDQNDLGGQSCGDLDLGTGLLSCLADCTLDTRACSCGNGTINAGEDCEGANMAGQTCESLGFASGSLSCNANCSFDDTECVPATCGNGVKEGTENCDGDDLNGASCLDLGFGAGALACDNTCGFDVSGCFDQICGDSNAVGAELCDRTDLNGESCQTITGIAGGALACSATCDGFVTTNCSCGNGVLDPGELCDPGQSTVNCDQRCQPASCGDGIVNQAPADVNAPALSSNFVGDIDRLIAFDIDSDGLTDVFLSNASKKELQQYEQSGAGFIVKKVFPFTTAPSAIATEDFNSDGRPDIAVLLPSSNQIALFISNTAGLPDTPTLTIGTVLAPVDLVAADFNLDGKIDLAASGNAVTGNPTGIGLSINTSSTATPSFSLQAKSTGLANGQIAVANINNDPFPDLVIANLGASAANPNAAFMLGSAGGFGNANFFDPQLSAGAPHVEIQAADLNNDSLSDIIVGYQPNNISVLLNQGNLTFIQSADFLSGSANLRIALGDLNTDGNVDLALIHRDVNAAFGFLGDGKGGFPSVFSMSLPPNQQSFDGALAVLDTNIGPDLILGAKLSGGTNFNLFGFALSSPEQCDDGNTNNADQCGNTCRWNCAGVIDQETGHCYEPLVTPQTHASAEQQCESDRGHLATLNSVREERLIVPQIPDAPGPVDDAWIGLLVNNGGLTRWLTHEPLSFIHFIPPAPSNLQNQCGVLVNSAGVIGWQDVACNLTKPALCEYEPLIVAPF